MATKLCHLSLNLRNCFHLMTKTGLSASRHCAVSVASTQPMVTTPPEPHSVLEDQTAGSVLAAVTKSNLSTVEIVNVINTLTSLVNNKKAHVADIQNNSTFEVMCAKLGKNSPNLNQSSLIFSLRNLLTIGLPPNCYVVKSLETEVLWKLRKMSMKHLVAVLSFHCDHQTDNLQREVVAETIQQIQRRWVEISDMQDVCMLLSQQSKFNKEFLGKIEDRAVEVVEKASVSELARLFVLLASLKLRSTPLLRSMAFHLSKHHDKLDVNHMTNVLCAMNSLSFPDQLLLQRISSDLLPEISSIKKSSHVAAILTSLGQMKWKDAKLLEGFTDWFTENLEQCRTQDLVAYILTAAGQNFTQHTEFDDLLKKMLNRVTEETVRAPSVWLDIVWSLVVLEKASHDHLASVLERDFYQKLQTLPSKLKLQNVNASAKYECVGYKGPLLQPDSFDDVWAPKSKESQKLSHAVCDGLSNFLPKGKFLGTNKTTPAGIMLDAEFVVDNNAKPVPLTTHNFPEAGSRSSPAGVHRVAVMVLEYNDFLHRGDHATDLTGVNVLAFRLLQKLGYTVVEVPYTEFKGIKTIVKKVQYLQKIVADAIVAKQSSRKTAKA